MILLRRLYGSFILRFMIKDTEVRGLAYTINDECINCGVCESECPVDCIKQEDSKYVINAEECISCGACAAVCPVDAAAEA